MADIEPNPLQVTIYLEIITFLAQSGLLKEISINPILDKYFTYEKFGNEYDPVIKLFLDKMVFNKHIQYNTLLVKDRGITERMIYHCSITVDGLIFHFKIQENTSIITTNASIITTNKALIESLKITKYVSLAALCISILALIASVLISLKPAISEDKLYLLPLPQRQPQILSQQPLNTLKTSPSRPSSEKNFPKK